MMSRDIEVGNVIVSVRRALNHRFIDAVFNGERSKRSTRRQRLTDDYMPPRRRHAIRANSNFDAMHVHRTVVAALHVVFTGPYELDRRAANPLGDCRSLALHV